MRLPLIMMFVMASGIGLHFSGIINFFEENVPSPKKMTAVKPKSIGNQVKGLTPRTTVYTFFDTLNDSTMTQYVDLEGKLMPPVLSTKKAIPVSRKILSTSPSGKKTARLENTVKLENSQKSKSVAIITPKIKAEYRYVVQVGSFRDEARALNLANLLHKNGFDSFFRQTDLADQVWHRVFIGRFVDEQKAHKAASMARSQFGLDAKIRETN
jgi:cell division septation protein DedD